MLDIVTSTGKEIIRYENINSDLLVKKITINGSYYDLEYQLGLLGQKIGRLPLKINESDRSLRERLDNSYF